MVVNERETRRRTPGVPLYFSLPHTISDALTSGHGLVQQSSDFTRANDKVVFMLNTHGLTKTLSMEASVMKIIACR